MQLILASSSPARQKLLKSFNISFKVIPHNVDEKKYQRQIKSAPLLCQTLARKKVESISSKNVFILGADQMAFLKENSLENQKANRKLLKLFSFYRGKLMNLFQLFV